MYIITVIFVVIVYGVCIFLSFNFFYDLQRKFSSLRNLSVKFIFHGPECTEFWNVCFSTIFESTSTLLSVNPFNRMRKKKKVNFSDS